MTIKTYEGALEYIYSSIPRGKSRFPGEVGIKRQKTLLKILGNPQNKIKVIHVAGTSGKGSVVKYLSLLLEKHGFTVGTTVSPHLLDIRERVQINNLWISKEEYVEALNQIIPAIEKVKSDKWGEPTYFEINLALAFWVFNNRKVDYAVIETGMGGLFDGTNTIDSHDKLAIITRIGLDHTSILGKKISDIAFQKAGIIKNKNQVLALWQNKKIRSVFEEETIKKLARIEYIKRGVNFRNVTCNDDGLVYDFKFKELILQKLQLNNLALYQVENSALALSALKILSDRDKFKLNQDLIVDTFKKFKFEGRMEVLNKKDKTLVLDGAHNPQKMNSFVKSLKNKFGDKKFIFVIAFRQRKDFSKMLKTMIPLASKFIFTSFVVKDEDMIQVSQAPEDMVKVLKRLSYDNYEVVLNSEKALKKAVSESNQVVVTSSLYLLKKIYPKIKNILQ